MCGVAGFIADGLDAQEARGRLERMTACLVHRGPDGDGHWVDGEAALGHRRLAIVDLSPTGAQPMLSATGRYAIAFNGEIYNHERLRPQVVREGAALRGTSDTEVLLALVEARGIDGAIDAAIGQFAFALWDRHERTLTLARDRMGEKPMYYGWHDGAFVFGSELDALRAYPGFDAGIDRDALAQLLRWQYVPAPASIYAHVRKLRAGELLRLKVPPGAGPLRERAELSLHRYWRIEDQVAAGLAQPFDGSPDAAVDELDACLADAVKLQLRADVPLGAFLSGGIDSSLVVALMQKQAAHRVRTFSIGFDDPRFDESAHARRVAEHLRTEHTELRVTEDDVRAVVPLLPRMFAEPFADASQIPTYLVARLARQHVTVSLSGDGGDEIFGGYRKYALGSRLHRIAGRRLVAHALRSAPGRGATRLVSALPRIGPRLAPRRVGRLAGMLAADAATLAAMLSDNCPDVSVLVPGADGEPAPGTEARAPGSAPYGVAASLADMLGYLPDDVLTKVDRASMAVSLESRAPMLDHRVVALACRLPWSQRGGRGNDKRVLRALLYRYVPRALVDRPKMGFSVPIARWLRQELAPWAEALVHGAALRDDPFLDAGAVQARWREHREGRADRSAQLWAVLMYLDWRTQRG